MHEKLTNLLLVDDDPGDRRLVELALKHISQESQFTVTTADSLVKGLDCLRDNQIDLVLLDLGLPDSHGLGTVDRIHKAYPDIPIVVLTGLASEDAGLLALRRGASDYLTKGSFSGDMLFRAIRYSMERKQLEQQLIHLASHDPLTGLLNRRVFEDSVTRAAARARRGTPSTLLLFDIDRFKPVNDTFGHATGDDVLVRIVQLVREQLRTEDVFARLGGDEFAVLLDSADLSKAQAIAERVRQSLTDLTVGPELETPPSLSIGLVEIDGQQEAGTLLNQADIAMYQAKDQGRNQVVCFQPKSVSPI